MNLHSSLIRLGIALALLPSFASAVSTGLDDTFADNGVALFPSGANEVRTVAHLPRADGGSVAVVAYVGAPCVAARWCVGLVSFLENGTRLPPVFVANTINFASIAGAAIDAQGRIVVAGSTQVSNNDYDFLVARVMIDATPDASFGSNGRTTIPFDQGGEFYDIAHAVAIDNAGRIVVVGETERDAAMDSDFAVVRLLPTGARDSAFGTGATSFGRVVIPFNVSVGNPTDVATAVSIDGSDRVLVGGTVNDFNLGVKRMGIARLTAAGTLDPTWCATACNFNDYPGIHSGRRTIYFGNGEPGRGHELTHMAVDSAGGPVTVGRMRFNGVFSGFAQGFSRFGDWFAEIELDGGETAPGNAVTAGSVTFVDPKARSSDLIVTGTSGVGEDLFFAQRLTDNLVPVANWGSTGVNDSVFAFSATNGFTGDPGVDIPGLASIDRRGRVLMAGAVKAPLSTSAYNGMAARLSNPLLIFFDGLEGSN